MTERRAFPKLFQALVDAFSIPDLRRRILFTIGILIIFRFIAHIPVPGVDPEALERLFRTNQLLGLLDVFSGGAMRYMSIAALGVYPYITASIVMQLLIPIVPRLQALAREGEIGRQKLNRYTHWLTVPIAMLQSYGMLTLFQREGVVSNIGLSGKFLLPTIAMIMSLTAGTSFLVWLGERITERGIGEGVSLIIFSGIVAGTPLNLIRAYQSLGIGGLIKLLILFVAIAFFIVYVTIAQRRIPVQYSRSIIRGGRMYRQSGGTYLPLMVNSAGMIPLIFAMSIMLLPGTIASYFVGSGNEFVASLARGVMNLFSASHPFYWILYFALVVAFTFFYTAIIFEQQNIPETLQRQGAFIPGIRPGKKTAEYLNRVINRLTWGGAIFLGLVAIMPVFASIITGAPPGQARNLMVMSSAGILIVVGVALDTMRQVEAQLLIRRYEGFMR